MTWYGRHGAYRIRPFYLLCVKDPAHLDEVMRQQRWLAHIGKRLGRQHAVISPRLIPLLAHRLVQEGFPLDAPPLEKEPGENLQNVADSWLALEVLAGLEKLIRLPFRLQTEGRTRLGAQLTAAQQAALAQKVEQVLDGVAAALRGRDAYFVPEQPVNEELVTAIEQAMREERELEISYQGLVETAPRLRRVEPLEPHYLEEQAGGTYLHGYCYLAEGNRVFRLDRVQAWRVVME